MRKVVVACCLSFLAVPLALAQPLGAKLMALNEGPVAVQWDCAKAERVNSLDAGDQANHAFMIEQVKCTATKGEIAGIKQREGVATEFHEVRGSSDRFHGVFVETLANGDRITYDFKGTATVKAGALETATNTWSATSGTGKFKGIKASGTCRAAGKPDGTTTFDCSGKYATAP